MEEQNYTFQHSVPIQIRFNDIDLLGHVNNAVMQEYFDLGRMHYLNDTFNSSVLFEGNEALIIASVNTNFLAPIFLKEEMMIETAVEKIGTKSLRMRQHLTTKTGKDIKATCESVMVAINKKTGETVEIPLDWRQLMGKMEGKSL